MSDGSEYAELRGTPAAPGTTVGPAFRLQDTTYLVEETEVSDTVGELYKLEQARRQAVFELQGLYAKTNADIGADEAAIFDAHLAFLEDPGLFSEIESWISDVRRNAAYAVSTVLDAHSAFLAADDNPVLQARSVDLQDIKQRLVRILNGTTNPIIQPSVPSVILAHDLLPSQTMLLDRDMVVAFCTVLGGATSHVAILAHGMGLPAVVGLGQGLLGVQDGTVLAVDGNNGIVHIAPSASLIAEFVVRQALAQEHQTRNLGQAKLPAQTSDGVRVALLANISTQADALEAMRHGAEGVGLLRTELFFMGRENAPNEDQQLAAYRAIADAMERRPITIRTLDIGGDKPVSYLVQPSESNPALGMRGVRLAIAQPDLLRAQLRAIWRIGPGYPVSVMFPMITTLDELLWLRNLSVDVYTELVTAREPILDMLRIGIMVEVPSAAILAHHFAPLVDFFSIGTNDLTQYTLAVDRTNAAVSYLSDALHPAVINLIAQTTVAAHAHGKSVGVCGELAGDPNATSLFLGLGVSSLSMTPASIPTIKATLAGLDSTTAIAQAQQAIQQPTSAAVRALLAREALR